jgi:hypothetical protein
MKGNRLALEPFQTPILWVPETVFPGIKQQGCEDAHTSSSSAEIKERVELYLHFHIRLCGLHRNNKKERKKERNKERKKDRSTN